jgi:hypothetical protein
VLLSGGFALGRRRPRALAAEKSETGATDNKPWIRNLLRDLITTIAVPSPTALRGRLLQK